MITLNWKPREEVIAVGWRRIPLLLISRRQDGIALLRLVLKQQKEELEFDVIHLWGDNIAQLVQLAETFQGLVVIDVGSIHLHHDVTNLPVSLMGRTILTACCSCSANEITGFKQKGYRVPLITLDQEENPADRLLNEILALAPSQL